MNFCKKLVFVLLFPAFMLGGDVVFAEKILSPDVKEIFSDGVFLGSALGDVSLNDYTLGEENMGGEHMGEKMFRAMTRAMLEFMKFILIPAAVLLLVYSGVELIVSQENEEKLKQRKMQVVAMATGFVLILLVLINSDGRSPLVDGVLFGERGDVLMDRANVTENYAAQGVREIYGILSFVESFVVVLAVGYLIITTLRYMFFGDEETEDENLKQHLIYIVIGVVFMLLIRPVVNFLSPKNSAGIQKMDNFDPDAFGVLYEHLSGWTNFILGFVGVFAVISIIWGGIRLITHFGDEAVVDEAKNMILYSVLALVLAFSAYTIISYFLLSGHIS